MYWKKWIKHIQPIIYLFKIIILTERKNENLSFHRKYIRKIWYIRSKNASFFRFVFSLSSFSIFAFSILYKRRYQIRNANNEMFYSHENNLKILIMKNRFTKAIASKQQPGFILARIAEERDFLFFFPTSNPVRQRG